MMIVDALSGAAGWTAVASDGSASAGELTVDDDPDVVPGSSAVVPGDSAPSARITATAAAAGYELRRALGPVDLSGQTELRLSMRSTRVGGPPFLELRLGSAALPAGDPANTWRRWLSPRAPGTWDTVRVDVDDLAPGVASAVTGIVLRCLDADPPFTAHLRDLVAVRPRMLADADRALESALTGIVVDGKAVPVAVRATAEAEPAAPALDIVQLDLRYAPARAGERRSNRAGAGAGEVAMGEPYDVDYAVTPVAATRAAQVELLEAVLARLSPYGHLMVDGEPLPVEQIHVGARERVGSVVGAAPVLFFRVGVRGPETAGTPLSPVRAVAVAVGQREVG